ncbi:MAG: redoxin domain-containing protein [Planctomycetes bacterium]|nr:redoxin domain-containing protein [Planctomycetota bacterium]
MRIKSFAPLFLCLASAAFAQGRGPKPDKAGGPKPGDEAPDFTLKALDGESEVTLSDFKDKRPVVLIFASYS